MAAVLACGRGAPVIAEGTVLDHWRAALSHRSAAELWGLLPAGDGLIHVSIPSEARRGQRTGIRVHRRRALLAAAVTCHKGIPVTTPAWTVLDLRQAASAKNPRCSVSPRDVRRAIRKAAVLGLPLTEEIGGDRTRSDLEALFLRRCRAYGLPEPEINVRIGSVLVDFLWRDHRLVAETDGYRYHRGRAAFEEDRGRDLKLRAMGYDVIRFSERQVADEPMELAAVLDAALGVRPGAP